MANPYFNAAYYLQTNPDVLAGGFTLETAEEHKLALSLGAKNAQGFYLGRPAAIEDYHTCHL